MDGASRRPVSIPAAVFARIFSPDLSAPRTWGDRRREGCKRALDVTLAAAIGLIFLPVIAAITLVVRLSGPGPVFYADTRIGRRGRRIRIYKFRTMVDDAERVLREYLDRNPAARTEWEETRKLKFDPRVTKTGQWLRRTSLDELPQVWNVLRGDMSFVGPRPILVDEVDGYGRVFALYATVRPGITGLWQVSGRNNTSYRQRVFLAAYYVRNRNLLMDAWIVARTPWAVVSRTGAY